MGELKFHTKRSAFVDSRVMVTPVTDTIIDAIMPHFPVTAKVISGYLSEEQLYWKVNYHWEYLLDMIDHGLTLDLTAKQKAALEAIRKVVLSNQPDPKTGYKASNTPGLPKDKSSHETILARHRLLAQSKKDFKSVVAAAELESKSTRPAKTFALACALVATPAKGKHGTGYALDIKGNNKEIAKIAAGLGASLVLDEESHVHVEFAKGVQGEDQGAVTTAKQASQVAKDSRLTNVKHGSLTKK